MNKNLILVASLSVLLAGTAIAQDQHRRPDDIKQYLEHLDSTERDRDQKPAQIVEALRLKPGMAVADLGSGSGYFTRRFVEAVTETGMVYAVDVEPEMLAYAKESIVHMHVPYTAEFILARSDSPKLPFESVDLLFICNTIHHLDDRSKYFRDLASSLKPGGRISIIDFYPDERSGKLGFPKHHLVSRETIVKELTDAGYRLDREHSFLPRQYFLEFTAAQSVR
ncbi:MAG: methyltransferase domain-containing protein [Nitrospirota bacterium]|nr:methyltransferase domain-containing protein [Nitrospirota bacterium]MDP2382680.1 methyltransferase domain-containing protein [Nitrospirota bacterium]MDP3598273.1 methyltransferase domain-containing protein [Nitrospirota bacterium]